MHRFIWLHIVFIYSTPIWGCFCFKRRSYFISLLQLDEMSQEQELSVGFPSQQFVRWEVTSSQKWGECQQRDQKEKHRALFVCSDGGTVFPSDLMPVHWQMCRVQSEQYLFLCQRKILHWEILKSLGALQDATADFCQWNMHLIIPEYGQDSLKSYLKLIFSKVVQRSTSIH